MTIKHTGDDPQPDYGGRTPARRGTDLLLQDQSLDRVIDNLETMPEAASARDLKLEARRRRRSDKILGAATVLLVAIGFLFTYLAGQRVVQNDIQEHVINAALRSLDQTNAERAERGLAVFSTTTRFDPNDEDALIQALAAAVTARVQTDPQFSTKIPGTPDAGALHCPGGKNPNTITVMTPNGAKQDIYVCV
jgi:hypothetical protein